MANIPLINYINYLPMMILFTIHLVLMLLNKIELLKEKFVTLLRLPVSFCCRFWFLVSFRVKEFLLLFMILIKSHCLSHQIYLLLKTCMILSMIILVWKSLVLPALFLVHRYNVVSCFIVLSYMYILVIGVVNMDIIVMILKQ